ncbi:multidrug effflux MFS transporter [Novispirillum sp. DQ9]|uniref:multidrug effflux MFS transporter n=1 Tax=Novispirillum sp. DQ9 TaxID=3398612 RepID=UPI003C79BDA3
MDSPSAAAPPPAPPPRAVGWRMLAPLVLITASGPVSMQMFLPALADLRQDLGVSAFLAQMTISVALLTFGIAMLLWGPASDRFGRRAPLIAGVVLFIAGNVVCAIAPTIEVLIAGRVLNALGGAAGMVLTRAMVRDVADPSRVASAMSLLTVGQIVPPMLAPAVGGLLTEAYGWRMNFVVLVAVGAVAGLLALRLPETHHGRGAATALSGMIGGFGRLLRVPRFRGLAFFGAAAIAAYFAFLSGAPLVAVGALGMSPSAYGIAFISISLSFMAGNMVSARLSPRLGIDRMVLLGGICALSGAAVALGLALAHVWVPLALFAPTMLVAFGNGLSLNNAQAGAMAVDDRLVGAAAGLTGFLQMATGAAVAQVVGLTYDGSPVPMAVVMTLAGLLALGFYGLGRMSK